MAPNLCRDTWVPGDVQQAVAEVSQSTPMAATSSAIPSTRARPPHRSARLSAASRGYGYCRRAVPDAVARFSRIRAIVSCERASFASCSFSLKSACAADMVPDT